MFHHVITLVVRNEQRPRNEFSEYSTSGVPAGLTTRITSPTCRTRSKECRRNHRSGESQTRTGTRRRVKEDEETKHQRQGHGQTLTECATRASTGDGPHHAPTEGSRLPGQQKPEITTTQCGMGSAREQPSGHDRSPEDWCRSP